MSFENNIFAPCKGTCSAKNMHLEYKKANVMHLVVQKKWFKTQPEWVNAYLSTLFHRSPRCFLNYQPYNFLSHGDCSHFLMFAFYTKPPLASPCAIHCHCKKVSVTPIVEWKPIIINRPISNFTQRVCKACTLYMQSRGTLLKKLAPSDYICNLISLVPKR